MASKNKSEKLKLNLWAETDRPQRADFNSDNMIIDAALGEHLENDQLHLTAEEKARAAIPLASTAYQGNGEASRAVNLPVDALAVMVYCEGMPFAIYDKSVEALRNYSGFYMFGAGSSAGVSVQNKTLVVTQDTQSKGSVMNCFNESGKQYRVVVIK